MMESRYVNLIDTLYDASVNQGALDQFVQQLAQLTDSTVGGIFSRDDTTAQKGFVSSYGASTETLTHFERSSEFHRDFCSHLTPQPVTGSIAYTQDILPGERLHSANFYSGFLKPQGLEQANCLFIEHGSNRSLTANFMRERSQGNYEASQQTLFRHVMPHLQRTFRLKQQTNDLHLHQSQAWEMLKVIPYGVIVFSNQQKVMYVNQAAEQMVFASDGLALHNTHLSANISSENKQLRHLLKSTIDSTVNPNVPMMGGDLLISRPSGKRSYSVMVNPISAVGNSGGTYPAAIVIVQDHEQDFDAPIERMRMLYDLTPAESRVAHQMMLGKSLESCAESLGHTVSTSRNLLKRVFAKTETGRQNELVSLMLRSPLNFLPRWGGQTRRG
ncbi:MAG: helix-turn-helix transcriptional regulator [Gammaproteobacteria bacterium]|uniref:helix-turn-helix transcriptional regulator n=1 Tax=Pseudomaricurvus alcaniphilus TaxID=1166482 RepID=UPI00140CF901|nr:helix-turn-helix transcriptional regulator [Pseudomaricurvus alcaniphilus]MBR9911311.1 helix-turn-helix transcriptional regulator [Gammaproteobacteria bacterium]NHN39572.1 helix-turn-helix transcriptional regulator [Pseudomaricurvus alcaniphilus]